MRKEDLKNWTRDMLKDKIIYQEALLEQRNKDIEIISKRAKELNDENDLVKAENASLKQRIKDLEDVCDGGYLSDYEPQLAEDDDISLFNYECIKQWESGSKLKKKIAELQDQHQQDCIRYNDMRTAYLVTLDELARLREQFGIG